MRSPHIQLRGNGPPGRNNLQAAPAQRAIAKRNSFECLIRAGKDGDRGVGRIEVQVDAAPAYQQVDRDRRQIDGRMVSHGQQLAAPGQVDRSLRGGVGMDLDFHRGWSRVKDELAKTLIACRLVGLVKL